MKRKAIAVGMVLLSGLVTVLFAGLYMEQLQQMRELEEQAYLAAEDMITELQEQLEDTDRELEWYKEEKKEILHTVGAFMDACYLSGSKEEVLSGVEAYVTKEVYDVITVLSQHWEYQPDRQKEYSYYSSFCEMDPAAGNGEVMALCTVRTVDETVSMEESYLFCGIVEEAEDTCRICEISVLGAVRIAAD